MKRFSETATRAALANGAAIRDNAHYTLNAGYRVHIDGEQAGYITSDLFGKLLRDGTITASFHGYGYTEYMTPDQITAAHDAAAAELAAITTPGTIELRARRACTIGARRVRDGEHFLVTVYGDGTQASPANAYGKLYDFRTADHAHLFAIISRPEPEQDAAQEAADDQGDDIDAQSARVEAATRAALGRAGVLCEEEPAQEADPQNAPPVKLYTNERTNERTARASVALGWHRVGDAVQVRMQDAYWGELLRCVTIQGAPQEAPREDENRAHCRRIAETLEAYAVANVRRCPECGQEHRREWGNVGDVFRCPECGHVGSVDAWEWLGVYDFLADALDIEYRVAGRARDALRSVRVMVACGGPNIYIDTASRAVELYWWNERASFPLDSDTARDVDEWAAELWACM